MAIRVSYQPSPQISGPVAQTAGKGFFTQYADKFNLGQHQVEQTERLAKFGEQNANLRTTAQLQSREAIAAAQMQQQQMRDYQNYIASQQAMQAQMMENERARRFGLAGDITKQRLAGLQQGQLQQQRAMLGARQDERDFQQSIDLQRMQDASREQFQYQAQQGALERLGETYRLEGANAYIQGTQGVIEDMISSGNYPNAERLWNIHGQIGAVRQSKDMLSPEALQGAIQPFIQELGGMRPQAAPTAEQIIKERTYSDGRFQWYLDGEGNPQRPAPLPDSPEQQMQAQLEESISTVTAARITAAQKQYAAEMDAWKLQADSWPMPKPGEPYTPPPDPPQAPRFDAIPNEVRQQMTPVPSYSQGFSGPLPQGSQRVSQMQGASGPFMSSPSEAQSMFGGGSMQAPSMPQSGGAPQAQIPQQADLELAQAHGMWRERIGSDPQAVSKIDAIGRMRAILRDYPDGVNVEGVPEDVRRAWAEARVETGL